MEADLSDKQSDQPALGCPRMHHVPALEKNEKGGSLRYLGEHELNDWDTLVATSPQGSVFCYSWWLRAACASPKVLGYFEGKRLVAGIALNFQRAFGFRICRAPELTFTWGVVIEPLTGKPVEVASRQTEILRIFAGELAKQPFFFQLFHPSLQNWLPFRWQGFKQTTRFTYAFEDLTQLEAIRAGMRQNIRGDIKKALRQGIEIVRSDCDPVFDLISLSMQRQSKSPLFDRSYFERIYTAAASQGAGACFTSRDKEGRNHAGALLVWDARRCYYLAGGGDPHLRNSGATSLLISHLIEFAATHSACFDFEGSDVESIERFFRAFGAKQVPYNQITKFPAWAKVVLALMGKI